MEGAGNQHQIILLALLTFSIMEAEFIKYISVYLSGYEDHYYKLVFNPLLLLLLKSSNSIYKNISSTPAVFRSFLKVHEDVQLSLYLSMHCRKL